MHCVWQSFHPKDYHISMLIPKVQWDSLETGKDEEQRKARNEIIIAQIPDSRDYISIAEAVALYSVSKDTLYRLIRHQKQPAINLGKRLTRISRKSMDEMFAKLPPSEKRAQPQVKLYNLEPENCYTIGEAAEKHKVTEGTIYKQIRKFGIPTRQIGKFVYVPRKEIDNLYK